MPDKDQPSDRSDELGGTHTVWSDLDRAHGDSFSRAKAQLALVERYRTLVHRYLLGATHDSHAADELTQEFCLRLVRGDFRNADPQRGRFRDLLKTSLSRMVIDHYRRVKRQPTTLDPQAHEEGPAGAELPEGASEEAFLTVWREELLKRAWEGLRIREEQTGQRHFSVLRCLADHPELKSPELAELLSAGQEKPVTADWVRKWLKLAREIYADLLLYEVAQAAETKSLDELETELGDLGLLNDTCRAAVQRRREAKS